MLGTAGSWRSEARCRAKAMFLVKTDGQSEHLFCSLGPAASEKDHFKQIHLVLLPSDSK